LHRKEVYKGMSHFNVAFVGDFFLQTRSGIERPISDRVEAYLQQVPWVFANLETVLAESGVSLQKSYISRSVPGMAAYLHEVGIKAVNLANNHTFDYGLDGFRQTIIALQNFKIAYFGAICDGKQSPFLFHDGSCSIGVLGYTIGSTEESGIGVALLSERRVKEDIMGLKSRNVDRIIVNLHWGEEYVAYPSTQQQRVARRMIDWGADVIIGHHPHVVQGIERYKDGLIFYSLGNFNFINSSGLDRLFPCTRWGLIVLLRFSQSASVEYLCLPVRINEEYQPEFPPEDKRQVFLAYLDQISEPLTPAIQPWFWFRHAAVPHFRNHLPSFVRRIRRYGIRHLYQMVRWLISPSNYGFYLGLILHLLDSISGRNPSIRCPDPYEAC